MNINREMLIAEFKRQIDFSNFVESNYTASFRKEFLEYALTLIQELTEENERLKKSYRLAVRGNAETCNMLFKAEDEVKEIRAKTVREMARRLKNAQERQDGIAFDLVSFETIDRIEKEMIGEKK